MKRNLTVRPPRHARAGRTEAALENANRALAIDPGETRALVVRTWLEIG
jgi:hypothetical protein